MYTIRPILILFFLLAFMSGRAGAEIVIRGPESRLEALPAPGQLQPVPRPPQVRQPRVPPPPAMPYVNRGGIDPRTGEFFPPQGRGIMNPRTGEFYPPVNGQGYFNPRTGEYYPRLQ